MIFDEAHNIEDTAREAASVDLLLADLEEAKRDAAGPAIEGELTHLFSPLQAALARLVRWLEALAEDRQRVPAVPGGFERWEACWSGGQVRLAFTVSRFQRNDCTVRLWVMQLTICSSQHSAWRLLGAAHFFRIIHPDLYHARATLTSVPRSQIRRELQAAGLDPQSVTAHQEGLDAIKAAFKEAEQKGDRSPRVGKLALALLARLLKVLSLMYTTCPQGEGPDEASDYRLVVQRWVERPRFGAQPRKRGRCGAAGCSAPA